MANMYLTIVSTCFAFMCKIIQAIIDRLLEGEIPAWQLGLDFLVAFVLFPLRASFSAGALARPPMYLAQLL